MANRQGGVPFRLPGRGPMRAVIQRVHKAAVVVEGQTVARMGHGLVVLLGLAPGDTMATATSLWQRLLTWRVFADESGKMNTALPDCKGELLVVPQFTLYGSFESRRPSFSRAMPPPDAHGLFEAIVAQWQSNGTVPVQAGVFGASMTVSLDNAGPVTWWWEHDATR